MSDEEADEVTRIIAGSAGGRRLEAPRGEATRPTSDRVREAIFSALEARGALRGARVLDLYCGSGALGLEAASRGAAEVLLVDSSRLATEVARRNASALNLTRVTVVLASVQRHLAGRPPWQADLVLCDPPYALAEPDLAGVLSELASRWLAPHATVVVERSGRSPEPRWPSGMRREQVRRYGDTAVWSAVRESGSAPEPG